MKNLVAVIGSYADMENKNRRIYIRLTPNEIKLIRSRMELVGIQNLSAYIRKIAINGFVIQMDMTDVKEVLRLLKINSNNLNQYAKKANETRSIYKEDIEDLRKSQMDILHVMGTVLDRLSGID